MPSVNDIMQAVTAKVQGFMDRWKQDVEMLPKPKGDDGVADWIKQLFDEAMKDRDSLYSSTRQLRVIREHTGTPESFYKACELLEAGNSWEVFGHRNIKPGDEWKQERVDGELQRQIRARTNYLTSSWHDITISPDIEDIDAVFDQEREKMGWGHFVKRYVKSAQVYGEAICKMTLDKTTTPDVFKPIVCERGSVVKSPFSKSLLKSEGCWYIVHATTITDKQAMEEYPGLDVTKLAVKKENRDKTMAREYAHTKSYWKLECYMDDDTVKPTETTQEDLDEIADENQRLLNGEKIDAQKGQNHLEHIKSKGEALTNLMDMEPVSDEELAQMMPLVEAYHDNILSHINAATEDELTPAGYERVYPDGRLVVVIGDAVAQDDANPFMIPWRKLFREIKNEEMVSRVDGRGDAEILYPVEKMLDTQLSRLEDFALTAGIPKKVRHTSDRPTVESDEDDNDPTKTMWFKQIAPTYIKSDPPSVLYQLYQMTKQNAQNTLGVNEVTFGKPPTSNASGDLAETLLRQNEQVITGELNQELVEALKDIVETFLLLYRKFYTDERQYFIEGTLTMINVSDILSYQEVQGELGPERVPIEAFEVNVEPMSAFPYKWEKRMATLARYAGVMYPDGTPLVPAEMIRDELAVKFPELGENGKYNIVTEAYRIGMAVIRQQQEAEAIQQGAEDGALKRTEREFVKGKMSIAKQPTNGQPA